MELKVLFFVEVTTIYLIQRRGFQRGIELSQFCLVFSSLLVCTYDLIGLTFLNSS